MSDALPREGMMAVVRNRRAMITGVRPYDADSAGRFHLVEVEYTDGLGVETDELLWEIEPGRDVLEPSALPRVQSAAPMETREFDAMVRAARWSALTPSLPFSGLAGDRPPVAAPLYGAIHPEAYQLVPALRALEMPRVALMLADAVGLGKTIQAGMVLRELMLRRRIRRVLVLCPAALRTQWREEMQEKFALPFEVVDRASTLKLQREIGVDANPWRTHERVIASYHYLKQPDVLEQFRSTAEPGGDGRLRWDLLIVDEAHNLSPASFGSDSDLSKMLQRVAPWFEHRVFLTATPHNGHTRSFSGLLEALDPVRFTRKSELDDEDRRRVGEAVIRRLKSEINTCYTAVGEPARFSDRHVEALPALHFGSHERALNLALRDFRKALKKVLRGADHQDRTAAHFATEVLQKRLMSGPWAFGQSWLALVDGLESTEEHTTAGAVARVRDVSGDDTDDDAERESRQRHAGRTVGAWLRQWREALSDEIAELTRRVEAIGVSRVPPGLDLAAVAVLNSFAYDFVARSRCGGLHLNFFVVEETPLAAPDSAALLAHASRLLHAGHPMMASLVQGSESIGRPALTPHERLRLRAMLEAIVASLYGLDRDDFAWILKDCDHPLARLSDKAFCRQLDPKGFWRVDKTADPELRHTVLSLAAFDDLQAAITAAGGDRDAGIQAFCDQHDGDGWMLPETLCLAELGLTRTVDVGVYDDRARAPQPVRSRMGERFLDWQLAQSVEESWAECERHAKAILEGTPGPIIPSARPDIAAARPEQGELFGGNE